MKKPDERITEEQRQLATELETLRRQQNDIREKIKNARTRLDESVKKHGDMVLANERWKAAQERENRPFVEKTPEEVAWFEELKERNARNLQAGIEQGWWEFVENGVPIPFATIIKRSDFHEKATMADILVKLGLFPSLTEARKNGKATPIILGEHRIKMKNGFKRIIIED